MSHVSTFPHAETAVVQANLHAAEVLEQIRSSKFAAPIARIRELTQQGQLAHASDLKRKLACVTWGGTFSKRSASALVAYSGLLVIDLDKLEADTLKAAMESLRTDPHVWAAFVSPSGNGIKVVFRVPTDGDDPKDFGHCWHACVSRVTGLHGVPVAHVDRSGKDHCRLCFVSHDPDLWHNPEATPLHASAPVVEPKFAHYNAPRNMLATAADEERPGDKYAREADVPALLRKHGWSHWKGDYWTRPGKENAVSGTWHESTRKFHCFTDAAPPLEPNQTYNPFALFAILEHGGDFAAAARALAPERKRAPLPNPIPVDPYAEETFEAAQPVALEVEMRSLEVGTDIDAGLRIVEQHAVNLRHAPGIGWLVWDGKRWQESPQAALEIAKKTARRWVMEFLDRDDIKGLGKAVKMESAPRLEGALKCASTDPRVAMHAGQFDANDWQLNVQNGIIDLRTGQLTPHDREAYHTKICHTDYVPDAQSAILTQILERLEHHSPGMAEFLRRSFGAALTGDVSAQSLWMPIGPGGSGKTTLVESFRAMLGDYGAKCAFATFAPDRKSANGSAATPDRYRLRGVRLATASEGEDNAKLDSNGIKELTGSESIVARKLYSEPIEIRPTWKIWLVSNYDVTVNADDSGFWRRMLKVPFPPLPVEERDPRMIEHLHTPEGRAALLAWAVTGCVAWCKEGRGQAGLAIPEAVRVSTEQLRADNDYLGPWWHDLKSAAIFGPGHQVPAREIRAHYVKWCEEEEVHPVGTRRFAEYLVKQGLEMVRTESQRAYKGLSLRS